MSSKPSPTHPTRSLGLAPPFGSEVIPPPDNSSLTNWLLSFSGSIQLGHPGELFPISLLCWSEKAQLLIYLGRKAERSRSWVVPHWTQALAPRDLGWGDRRKVQRACWKSANKANKATMEEGKIMWLYILSPHTFLWIIFLANFSHQATVA